MEEFRYEYDRDENGEPTGSRGYKNGKLFVEKKAIIGEDGAPGMLWTEYSEDGTKTVTEYNRILTGLVDRDQHIVQAAIRMPVEHKQ